jgi:AAA family ATP:ADP antiporter
LFKLFFLTLERLLQMRDIIPPASERKKIIPLGLMFFCILFNYTILRNTKDVLVITAPKSGAEIIPFIKTYVNLPTAIGFTALYSKLCDKFENPETVFYICTVPFLIFFGLFAWAIFPHTGTLHPHAFIDMISAHLPLGFAAPLSIIRNWSFAVFYVMAEMWGSVVASLLFWGCANEVTTVEEAKKYCMFPIPMFHCSRSFLFTLIDLVFSPPLHSLIPYQTRCLV